MEKFVLITYLFDFYCTLLTEKQRDLIYSYYFDDLSLGELSVQYSISRQSVFDTIKKAEQKLLDYENKLRLYEKHKAQKKIIENIEEIVHTFEKDVESIPLKSRLGDLSNHITLLKNNI